MIYLILLLVLVFNFTEKIGKYYYKIKLRILLKFINKITNTNTWNCRCEPLWPEYRNFKPKLKFDSHEVDALKYAWDKSSTGNEEIKPIIIGGGAEFQMSEELRGRTHKCVFHDDLFSNGLKKEPALNPTFPHKCREWQPVLDGKPRRDH